MTGRLLADASTSTRRALGLEEVAVVQGGPPLAAISTTGEPADALWEEARDAPGPQLLLCDLQESAGKGSLPFDPGEVPREVQGARLQPQQACGPKPRG